MSNTVLPALLVLSVVRESLYDKLVDLRESQFLVCTLRNSHCNESVVGEEWFLGFRSGGLEDVFNRKRVRFYGRSYDHGVLVYQFMTDQIITNDKRNRTK